MKFKLSNKIISKKTLPYIIAEVGVNHECSLSKAKICYLVPDTNPSLDLRFLTFL